MKQGTKQIARVGIVGLVCLGLLGSCEQNITVDLPEAKSRLAVDGRIEISQPPVVFLTRSQPYFAPVNINKLDSFFVHDAVVEVSNGNKTVRLQEVKRTNSSGNTIYLYTDPSLSIRGEVGESYSLYIEKDTNVLTATTSLPPPTPLDSMWYESPKDTAKDSLAVLKVIYDDPDTLGNYARYFTTRNPPVFNTKQTTCLPYVVKGTDFKPGYVFDDRYYNGTRFSFSLDRGQRYNKPVDPDTYGFFWRGDSVVVKWCAIDRDHFEFWESWEYTVTSSDNPFASPSRIKSNVTGGLGVWGGYSCTCHSLFIKK